MKIASEEIIPEQMIPQIDIDAILDLKEINQKFVNDLKKMSPFGPDNQKARILFAWRKGLRHQ